MGGFSGIARGMLSLAVAVGVLMAGPVFAQETDGWAYEFVGEFMSPYCPGRTLDSCPSPQAD